MRITNTNTITRYFYKTLASYSNPESMLYAFKYYNTMRLSFMDSLHRARIFVITPTNSAYELIPKHYVFKQYVNYHKQIQGL